MSLCYDFQKWTMLSLATVAVSLASGLLLINFAHADNRDYLNHTIDNRDFLNHTRHVNQLVETTGVLQSQCASQMQAQDVQTTKSCKAFFESIDKHLTATFNESATEVNAIKSTIGGDLVIK